MLVLVLFLLFTVLPFIELALLFQIGSLIGGANTLLLVLATGAAGAFLARQQGVRTLRAIQEQMAAGRMPGAELFDGALILVAGALLVTPGVVTDLIGFSLLLPPWRALLRRGLSRWAQGRVQVLGQFPQPQGPGEAFSQAPSPQAPFAQAFPLSPQDGFGPEVVRDVEAEVRDVEADVRDA